MPWALLQMTRIATSIAPMRAGETLGAWRRIDGDERARRADAVWSDERVQKLPRGWRRLLLGQYSRKYSLEGRGKANEWLRVECEKLGSPARSGVQPGDTDEGICLKALVEALLMRAWLEAVREKVWVEITARLASIGRTARADRQSPEWVQRLIIRAQAFAARADLSARGLLQMWPQGAATTREGELKRLGDEIVWRRMLRKAHAVLVESMAIGLGLVHAKQDCYVSDDSVQRRAGQRARCKQVLSSVVAVNDRGQRFELGELAARGVADRAVRRAELMTRISGFEVIANDVGHVAQFVTVTCPSRMHKWIKGDAGERDRENRQYDKTLPNRAQAYLADQWKKARSRLARIGLPIYGFRIAEPNHDGCPHWHLLLWHRPVTDPVMNKRGRVLRPGGDDAAAALAEVFARYFLRNDSSTERGAAKHRVTIEDIDPKKGSAVAYVAKYVAKNIDGYKVGEDLHGNPALESSMRVEAWASTWRIRQFQQIGGAPVTVWRELRRVHPFNAPVDAVQVARDGIAAVNIKALDALIGPPDSEEDEQARVRYGWAQYVRAQGGPIAKRTQHMLKLHREKTGELNRYGEVKSWATLGVACYGDERATVGIATFKRQRVDLLESERCDWIIVPKPGLPAALQRHAACLESEAKATAEKAAAVLEWHEEHGANLKRQGEALAPWTRVNNCTRPPVDNIGRNVVTTQKRGVFFDWKAPRRPPPEPSDASSRPDRPIGFTRDETGALQLPPQEFPRLRTLSYAGPVFSRPEVARC